MSLKDVCSQLKRRGVNIDAETLRETYADENPLARVEMMNLWQMLHRIEHERTILPDLIAPQNPFLLQCPGRGALSPLVLQKTY